METLFFFTPFPGCQLNGKRSHDQLTINSTLINMLGRRKTQNILTFLVHILKAHVFLFVFFNVNFL